MSPRLKKALFNGLWNTVCLVLLSFSLGLLWTRVLTGGEEVLPVLLPCAVLSVFLSAVDQAFRGKWKVLVFSLFLLGLIALYFLGTGPLFRMVQGMKAEILHLLYNQTFSSVYNGAIAMAVSAAAVFLLYSAVRDDAPVAGIFVFGVLSFICFVFRQYPSLPFSSFSLRDGMRMLLPGIAGCLLLLSASSGRRAAALPIVGALLACVWFLFPASVPQDPTLNEAARSLTDYREMLFPFAGLEERSSFSLSDNGYLPLEDRLGGSAIVSDEAVFRFSGEARERLYLRGRAYDTYTGLSWTDTLSGASMLFDGFTPDGSKQVLFDALRRSPENAQSFQVTLLTDDTTTVFAPLGIRSFTGLSSRMVLYYRPSTEVFLTRELTAGDRYEVEYDPETVFVPLQDDASWEWATEHYLTVPSHMQTEIWDLCTRITDGTKDPYEKASSIETWLSTHYRYSLEVEEPPENVDFVAYFLLGEQEGYCTYFASAMTVLCRMAGIPARYVTGFSFSTDSQGIAVVTRKEAHAWTEIYLQNYGWVTMDATPSTDHHGIKAEEPEFVPTDSPSEAASPSPSPSAEAKDGSTPSLVPSSSPSPEAASPAPSDSPAASASSSASSGSDPSPTPSAVPSASAAPSGTPSFSSGPSGGSPSLPFWIWPALVFLLLAFVLAARILLRDPDRMAVRRPEKAESLYLCAVLQLLALLHHSKRRSETWLDLGRRLSDDPSLEGIREVCERMSALVYGRDPAPDSTVARDFYHTLYSGCAPFRKASFRVRRAFLSWRKCLFP